MQLLRLIWPVILVTTISLLAMVLVAVFFANRFDKDAEATEKNILETAFFKITHNLYVLAEDNAWWDVAVDNTVISENQDWLNSTIGDVQASRNYVDGAIVMRPDNSVMYQSGTVNDQSDLDGWMRAGLKTALDNMIAIDGNAGVTLQGVIAYNDTLIAFGLSMIQPSGYKVYEPALGATKRPVLILYQNIRSEEYQQIEQDAGIKNLNFSMTHTPRKSALGINNINGTPVGFLNWTTKAAGKDLLASTAIPALFFLIVITIVSAYFFHEARLLIDNLEKADKAKMAFLASMSHEVRTPLNTIIGFAEIVGMELYGTLEGDKNKEYMAIIQKSGEHLLSIINDILDISKLEAGRFEVLAEPVDTKAAIAECMKIVSVSSDDKSIRMVADLCEATINSDARIIRQTVLNILSNAIKFTPVGGQVAIITERKDKDFLVTVSDNGTGMSQNDIATALEPFGRVNSPSVSRTTGTGLGLPIVDRFMKLVGGSMKIRSAVGHGTSVTLQYPCKQTSRSTKERSDTEIATLTKR